ncbi:MAG: PP2C family protein-serine/threonine phosphatase [Phycisphaerae bacterium]
MNAHETDKKLQDLKKLLEISRAMGAVAGLDELLNLIIDRSMELLNAERATLFLYDAESNELVSRIAAGLDELRVPADKGISGETIVSGETINVPDVTVDKRWNPEPDSRTGFKTRNILSVPLRDYEGSLVGVLQAINKRDGGFDDYDETVAEALGAQAGVALQRAQLIDHYVQKQQMERAMGIAREIQQGLLPTESPQLEGFDIAGFSQAADETGGDMYDFLELSDGRCMTIVADASGHGVGPALVIAETRAMLRAVSIGGADVPVVLRTVNDLLAADLGESRFVTCFFGLLDASDGSLSFASAGHGPLIFYNRRRDSFEQLPATGLPLAVMDGADYSEVLRRDLQSGDIALVTTDGFFEATNTDGEDFGIDRMLEVVRQHRDHPAERIITELRLEVMRFTEGLTQADDLTAVVVRKS